MLSLVMKNTTSPLITDDRQLISVRNEYGRLLPIYDDGYGKLYIHRDSMGISGIVRAQSWEDAYEICEDEFFPDADVTEAELIKEFGEDWQDDASFQEQYGYRNNCNGKDLLYAKDLNGDALDLLTPALAEHLGLTIITREYDEDEMAFVPLSAMLPTLL